MTTITKKEKQALQRRIAMLNRELLYSMTNEMIAQSNSIFGSAITMDIIDQANKEQNTYWPDDYDDDSNDEY